MVYVKGFVVTANYQDVTPEMIQQVSGFIAEELAMYGTATRLNEACNELKGRLEQAAGAAELEALGGTDAAERGWNALRKHNPNVDKSNGSPGGEIVSFSDLSHRQKVNYAVFAAGVLDVKREPRVFTSIAVEPAADVNLLTGNDSGGPTFVRRSGSGWWWVDRPDVDPGVDGWPWNTIATEDFPLTEVIS